MISVLVVDDHPLVRKGLRTTLEETADIRVTGEASSGEEALAKARAAKFDVILLDLSMPGMSGFDVLKTLAEEQPSIRILILSTFPEKQFAIRCFRAGALGYLSKESDSADLVKAIQKVHEGRKYVGPELAEQMADEIGTPSDKPLHETLSQREFQVLCHLGRGKSVSEVAEMLSLSSTTVSTYRQRILSKLRLETTGDLIVYVIENKITGQL